MEDHKLFERELTRRDLLKYAGALASAAALPGLKAADSLAASAAHDSGNSITFMAAEYSAKTVPFWKETIAAFEKANPGMSVNLRSIGWQQNHDTTARMIASNQLPDLVNTATIWLPEWVKASALQPVTPSIVPTAVQSRFVPSLF